MKQLIHWALGLLVLTTAVSLSGAWPAQQEHPKQQPKVQRATGQGGGQQGRNQKANAAAQRKNEKLKAIGKLLPTLKTSLGESIALAEKEAGGKAFEATLDMVAGKPTYKVGLMVADHFANATVDPETKVVTLVADKAKAGKKAEGGDDDGGDDEGEDEDDH